MKNELVTFRFTVKDNFSKYAGTSFNETHLIPSKKSPLDWAKENLTSYFTSDFKLNSIHYDL